MPQNIEPEKQKDAIAMEKTPAETSNPPTHTLAEILARLNQELEEGQADLQEHHGKRSAALAALRNAHATASDLSWELEDMEQRLRDLEAQRAGPADPLIEREITSIANQRTTLEEQVLTQMMMVDELTERLATAEQALAAAEQRWADRSATLLAERMRLSRD